jgi:hypothetical protein
MDTPTDRLNMKSDFEKLGVHCIEPYKKNGRWVFKRSGKIYDMAPAGITDAMLSPLIFGVDRLIQTSAKAKNISNPELGFLLLFSSQYFPNADVKFVMDEPKFDGWVYKIEEVNYKGVMPGQAAWVCGYMLDYFEQPPNLIYVKIEPKETTNG